MKKFFKRFKLSEWLIVFQLFLSVVTLFLTSFFDDTIIDIIGLVGNIVNGLAILIVFSIENSRNIKYYELTGQFIFHKLGESFSSFMDFVMSEEYHKINFDEHTEFYDKLVEIAKSDSYDMKRKLSRALPYLYDFDKTVTLDIIKILRKDIYEEFTDIRRRTIEAMLTIIQMKSNTKKAVKLANKFFEFFCYCDYDDSYTIVACIENFYFLHDYVYTKEKDKKKCIDAIESLKNMSQRAYKAGIGIIEASVPDDIDNIWKVLTSLSTIKNINNENYFECKEFIADTLANGQKYSKLTVVKNLFYTCERFPNCLCDHVCSATSSKYMMEQIDYFLSNAIDHDVFLAMPTVRYFDCVCNNIHRNDSKNISRTIIYKYLSSDVLLIAQTAFDKFSKVLNADEKFAKTIITDMIDEENRQVYEQGEIIKEKISLLSKEMKPMFFVGNGRSKFKVLSDEIEKNKCNEEFMEISSMIRSYNERVRFIGIIKKFRDDNKL